MRSKQAPYRVTQKQKERGGFSAALLVRHFLNLSASRDHDHGRPNHADRASGVRVRSTSDGCVPSTTLWLRGARVSSGPPVCCCSRVFQRRGPARGQREPTFAGNRRLHTLVAFLPEACWLQASSPCRRIGSGPFSIDVYSWFVCLLNYPGGWASMTPYRLLRMGAVLRHLYLTPPSVESLCGNQPAKCCDYSSIRLQERVYIQVIFFHRGA